MAHVSYASSDEKFQIQTHLEPVVESILSKCADSNRFVPVKLASNKARDHATEQGSSAPAWSYSSFGAQ